MSRKDKIRPNDPCPCGTLKADGSPLKFKKCCRGEWPPSPEKIQRLNERHRDAVLKEHGRFREAHGRGACYLCGESYVAFDPSKLCPHWLLRPTGVKKGQISEVLNAFGLFRNQAFLRWVANEEVFGKNINDLREEGDPSKLVDVTIKYKNILWGFSCGQGDFSGHDGGTYGRDPHFHFQMRIDDLPFINYGEFHSKLSDGDVFKIRAERGEIPGAMHTFRVGAGMQEVMDSLEGGDPLKNMRRTDDESQAQFNIQTFLMAEEGKMIDGEEFQRLIDESRATGKTVAELARGLKGAKVTSVISPPSSTAEKASRKPRKR